ncbi:MAG: four helix bundle protein [Flavobacterium sp.]|uniref:four helix bundle protein n=1 Tax=Flavobacterium sp. TaxID=239 RepID=UPI00121C0F91|nr:four helix bundle protein [Flavobacterium sp.]RZJ66746.1 MAG: four helix bundle protein [Flavobacterium sp.]
MKRNIVREKSYAFAIEIVELSQSLILQREFVLSRQILKSGTSIGANIREAEYAQSKADFIHKLCISLKEANETEYWLDLLFDCKYIDEATFQKRKISVSELLRLLTRIIKTAKSK